MKEIICENPMQKTMTKKELKKGMYEERTAKWRRRDRVIQFIQIIHVMNHDGSITATPSPFMSEECLWINETIRTTFLLV